MLKIFFLITDIVAIILSFLLAKFLRYHGGIHFIPNQLPTLIFLILTIILIAYFHDLYNHYYYIQSGRVFFKLVNVWIISFISYVLIGFLTKFYFLINSRGFIFYFFFITYPLIISFLRLFIIPRFLSIYFSNPAQRIIFKYVGPQEKFVQFSQFFNENNTVGINLINSSCKEICSKSKDVFLHCEVNDFGELYKKIHEYAAPGQRIHVAASLLNDLPLKWEWCKIDNLPVMSLKFNLERKWQAVVRRVIDVIISLLFLLIFLPFFIIIALAIKLDSRGPVIYKQKRCGKDGKEFTLYKFRSMYYNTSQKEREEEFKSFIENKTSKGKIINYSEVTRVGKILRRTSIDEFPQFLNVLKGDMTLIGPRPPIPYEVKYYKDWHKDRLKIKPGISGLWQVYGRGSMPCDSSIFLDLIYVLNRSLTLDIKLLFQTIPAVLLGKGAY
ncbi:MAG: exopolysaccharide biosynthesis polyprenyl glycosylphosphotransferase [candidate division WOR-3 bacterium]|nr:exopolysaccharide biosynthesis polyprenyl glycosylphosphotransferase [candidate division WOR-3 bacterium]